MGGGSEERTDAETWVRQRSHNSRCVETTCCPGNGETAEMWSALGAAASVSPVRLDSGRKDLGPPQPPPLPRDHGEPAQVSK